MVRRRKEEEGQKSFQACKEKHHYTARNDAHQAMGNPKFPRQLMVHLINLAPLVGHCTYVVHPLEPEVRRVRPDLALEVGVVAHVDVGRVQRGAKAERHHGGIWKEKKEIIGNLRD